MEYEFSEIAELATALQADFESSLDKTVILKDRRLGELLKAIKDRAPEERGKFGAELNRLKNEIQAQVDNWQAEQDAPKKEPIDVTAPFSVGENDSPTLVDSRLGSQHPIMQAQDEMLDIFYRMGFTSVESRQLDNQYYMFDSLNFPDGHPARDEYDTFILDEVDKNGRPLVAPAHTSNMQNRVLKARKAQLEAGEPIAVVVPGRVFRNEDLDARHEHTFYQIEGVYVAEGVTTAHLIATLKEFMQEYYQKEIEIKTQPFYFPFTEPSFEFAISCPFCDKQGCKVCGEGWIELLGCGMIHPNVLSEAGIDPEKYTGFAWGIGFMRMVMIKHGIEDIRHFQSGKLDFLRQFA
ncbi:phenylalanine--tRNA ligase subunit alpha [Candidatus Saccharibacteria bacterium]|nr:phenylalanine--tRNA ligase subunit alpha [Candidatus Saccharibacteria bacterium]MCB9821637.1 phenylalanine--tRNA ligase subunit alpha [Candidatus Nomurabacteria bacterium]